MKASSETFVIKAAERRPTPCMVSIVGRSSSGKTFSALRLAFGMQRVSGSGRMLAFARPRFFSYLASHSGR